MSRHARGANSAIGLLLLSLLIVLFGSGRQAAHSQEIKFTDVTERAGLRAPLMGIMGHGGAWGDFDGDGHLDLYVGGFADRPDEEYRPAAGPVRNRLLRNRGDGTFELAEQPAVELFGRTSGAVFADLGGDKLPELYVANNCKGRTRYESGPQHDAQLCRSKLFRNQRGKLVDISQASAACPEAMGTARNVGVFDFNADGRLDLLVLEDRFTKDPRSILFRNLGNLKFRCANRDVGLPDDLFGLGLAVADLNDDGRPDFFVGHSNRFFLSTPSGKYVEPPELRKTFAWQPLHGEDWPCGAAFGDLNRDGRLDLVLSIHCERARNRVYLNMGLKRGVPQFRDVSAEAGFPDEVPQKCPHVEIQDFDNDGWPDVYFSAAWLDEKGNVIPLVFRNTGLKGGIPQLKPPRPIGGPMVYFPAGPSADYDNDGRIDLFLINWFRGNHCRLLRNTSPTRHWLSVRVVGRRMNSMGIGSQVRVYASGRLGDSAALLGFSEVSTGYGYASGQPAECHFGLGDATEVDLAVKLPGGKVITRRSVAADQRLVVEEP